MVLAMESMKGISMKRKDILKFAAIETKYNNYRFRSRLEARHAVFFDTLGIKYYYEHEGYSLDGVAYLPDFWLPELDCFVEIKGQEPTAIEIEKIEKLAIYTGKDAYLISGNIGLEQKIYGASGPSLWRQILDEDGYDEEEMESTPEVRAILQALFMSDLLLSVDDRGILKIIPGEHLQWGIVGTTNLNRFADTLQEAHDGLRKIIPSLNQYRDDLIEVAKDTRFNHQETYEDLQWIECESCRSISIGIAGNGSPCGPHVGLEDTPRLIAAYAAARQARFDGR
jgi:hypothetical protein